MSFINIPTNQYITLGYLLLYINYYTNHNVGILTIILVRRFICLLHKITLKTLENK